MNCQSKPLSVIFFVFLLLTINISAQNPAYISGVANETEKKNLNELLNESHSILTSDLFRMNMLSLEKKYPSILLHVENDSGSGSAKNGSVKDLLKILRSEKPYRYVPVAVALLGDKNYAFALSGVIGDNIGASFALGRGNFSNWLSNNIVERSCAVNTISHEFSHLISSDENFFRLDTQPIRDRYAASKSGTNAVASYLIGTVAQCTWLQKKNYSPQVDLESCVKVFGHRGFNRARCWQFSPNQKIEYRSDLYQEHVISDN